MNILILGGGYLQNAFKKLGHKTFSLGLFSSDVILTHPIYFHKLLEIAKKQNFYPDALLYSDPGNLPLLLDPQNCPVPSIWYSIDTYCNPWHINYSQGFDKTLVAQKDFVPIFTEQHIDAEWFPLFCKSSQIIPFNKTSRDIPISFVGTIGHKNNKDRGPFLERFKRQTPLITFTGNFEPLFSRSKIVLNQTAFSEVNFRCFEAIACGAALLTETCKNGLSELFTIGEEILPTYSRNDATMAASIAEEYLRRPKDLEEIANLGQKAVMERHTDLARATTILEILQNLTHKSTQKDKKYKEYWVNVSFAILATDLPESMRAFKEFYMEIACGKRPMQKKDNNFFPTGIK